MSDMRDRRLEEATGSMRGERPLVPRVTPVSSPHVTLDPPVALVNNTPAHRPATRVIGAYGGYRKTLSFGYVCLVYHATTLFCKRNYSYKNDALGKTAGQMIGAALKELAALRIDAFAGDSDLRHLHGEYILRMRERFAPWLEAEDPIVAANSQLVIISRAAALLHKQMAAIGDAFADEGGFTERLSRVRLEARDAKVAAVGAPKCPECGGPMRKQVARKGRNAGNAFWSCCAYPNCHGTRPWGAGARQSQG